MADAKRKPRYQIINGIRFPEIFRPESIKEVLEYKPTSDDTFIVTYPKCGTTWMQIVALYIFRKGQEIQDYGSFSKLCPFIDSHGLSGIINMPRPGAFKTHLPYNLMPYSSDAKYIFVIRNPKDTCVSLYYHTMGGIGKQSAAFDDFFELFMEGEVEYNDYFDHLQSWYPHRNDKNIFQVAYEDMKADLSSVVVRLAAFLGQEYVDAIEKDNNVLRNILQYSDFEYMKRNLLQKCSLHGVKDHESVLLLETEPQKRKGLRETHFRKGIVGDWRAHLSDEQSLRIDQKFYERFGETEIYEKYKQFL